MGNTIGTIFRLTTFGESHGPGIGAVVDGCPAGVRIAEEEIQRQLDRRRPGQGSLTTTRDEADRVKILSGVQDGMTLGTPIGMVIENRDIRPGDYEANRGIPRPSHGDFTYRAKYGVAAASGGGRASARETVARVAGGAVAEKYLSESHGVRIVAWVSSVGSVDAGPVNEETLERTDVDATPVRCPVRDAAARMAEVIEEARQAGDSIGGIVTCVCRNIPAGWGEPVFHGMGAALAAAMMSIPAAKGFEVGSGFSAARMRGSEHNDPFVRKGGRLGTSSNRSGGIQAGITNGEPILLRVAFKPPASIRRPQQTADYDGNVTVLETKGRHDPCVAPRAVPVVEAMAALVLADMARIQASARRS